MTCVKCWRSGEARACKLCEKSKPPVNSGRIRPNFICLPCAGFRVIGGLAVAHPAYHFAKVSGHSISWRLRRNCSVTPGQLGVVYLMLCGVSLSIGMFFWMQGATFVLGFAGLELLAVGAAFMVYARHATDGEWISLQGSSLVVERETAGRRERAEFERQWVRVEPQAGERSLIELTARGCTMEVGRFVRPELRQVLAGEIRRALRAA